MQAPSCPAAAATDAATAVAGAASAASAAAAGCGPDHALDFSIVVLTSASLTW